MKYNSIKDFHRTGMKVTVNYEQQLCEHGYLPANIPNFSAEVLPEINKWCYNMFTLEHYMICGGKVWFDCDKNRTMFLLRWG